MSARCHPRLLSGPALRSKTRNYPPEAGLHIDACWEWPGWPVRVFTRTPATGPWQRRGWGKKIYIYTVYARECCHKCNVINFLHTLFGLGSGHVLSTCCHLLRYIFRTRYKVEVCHLVKVYSHKYTRKCLYERAYFLTSNRRIALYFKHLYSRGLGKPASCEEWGQSGQEQVDQTWWISSRCRSHRPDVHLQVLDGWLLLGCEPALSHRWG